jgi:hypothetical protein
MLLCPGSISATLPGCKKLLFCCPREHLEVTGLPTVTGIAGPYRFFFFSFDCYEPRHVHVQRDRAVCKFWLDPVILAYNNAFSAMELNRIRKIVIDNSAHLREAWDEHSGQ